MDKLRDHYEAIGQAALDKVKFTDDVGFEVSFGIVPDMTNGGQPVIGTWLILQLRHNMLIGQPPIVCAIPIPSTNIDEAHLARELKAMLEQARQARDEQNSTQQAMLPAGLRGKHRG